MITAPENMKDESLKEKIKNKVAASEPTLRSQARTMKDEYTHYDLVKYFGTLEAQ